MRRGFEEVKFEGKDRKDKNKLVFRLRFSSDIVLSIQFIC